MIIYYLVFIQKNSFIKLTLIVFEIIIQFIYGREMSNPDDS